MVLLLGAGTTSSDFFRLYRQVFFRRVVGMEKEKPGKDGSAVGSPPAADAYEMLPIDRLVSSAQLVMVHVRIVRPNCCIHGLKWTVPAFAIDSISRATHCLPTQGARFLLRAM